MLLSHTDTGVVMRAMVSAQFLRKAWPLLSVLVLFLSTVIYPSAAVSGGNVVGYIYEAKGDVSGIKRQQYSMGDEILNGDTITVGVGPQSRVVAFHSSKCEKIEFYDTAVTFSRTYYKPKRSPKIEVLKRGCRSSSRSSVGRTTTGGMSMRSGAKNVINVTTSPDFFIEGDATKYSRIEIEEQDAPGSNITLNIVAGMPLVEWPSTLAKLKPNTTYRVKLAGKAKRVSLLKSLATIENMDTQDASILVIIRLPDGK